MKKSKQLWIFIAVLVVFNLLYYKFQWGGAFALQIVSDALPIICSFVAVICLFNAVKSFKEMDFTRIAWTLIMIGITLDLFAESTYSILEVGCKMDMNKNFPSVADIFWCSGYIPLLIGLVMMFWGYKKSGFPMGNPKVYAIITFAFIMLFLALSYFLLIPILKDAETTPLTKFFYMYYPIADLLIVVLAAILMYITSLFGKGTISLPWKMLAIGFFLFTIADLSYSYLGWLDLYGNGNYIDILWHSGYLLFGLSALYQKELLESFN